MIKEEFGKYKVEKYLGGGRFADVYLGKDTLLKKSFALKIARAHSEEMKRLIEEARYLCGLEHRNIVRFYNIEYIGNERKRLVLVMEYVDGPNLRKVITEKAPMSLDEVTEIGGEILNGLLFAHLKGIVHRDVKPENILFTKKGVVKITDFGLARILSSDALSVSQAGTPMYMAPEQWEGRATPLSDQFGAACVIYEMATGVPAFSSDSLNGLRKAIVKAKIKRMGLFNRGVPKYLEEVIKKALSRNPLDRFKNCLEFRRALIGEEKTISLKPLTFVKEKKTRNPLKGLNPEQKEAVINGDGYSLVLGGTGTGKTTTLTRRLAYLINNDVPSDAILGVTFTNRASREMKERVKVLIRRKWRDIWLGTFHHICERILRKHIRRMGFSSRFAIYDWRIQISIMKSLLLSNAEEAKEVLHSISKAKTQLISSEEFKEQAKSRWEKKVAEGYQKYQRRLFENNALDFDDLILYTVRLFRENDDILDFYAKRFMHILVDEYQDINYSENKLLELLSNHHNNLFVTGDDDQAIYGFRGANIKFIQNFPKLFKNAKTYVLSKNYRSTQEILQAANNLISCNRDREEKVVIPTVATGERINIYSAKDEKVEANYVAKEIKRRQKKENRTYNDFAILFRINAQSRLFEEALSKWNIPFSMVKGLRFYERGEVRGLIASLKSVYNPKDRESFLITISTLFGLTEKTARKLVVGAKVSEKKINKYKEQGGKLAKRLFESIKDFDSCIQELRKSPSSTTPEKVLNIILESSGYLKKLKDRETEDSRAKLENIEEFLSVVEEFSKGKRGNLGDLLTHLSFLQNLDLTGGGGGVTLMTVHSSKGLEFPIVFMVQMVEGVFPHIKSLSSTKEIEEERRLCYVGMTRAQSSLYFTYPKKRRRWFLSEPSRFLYEIAGG